MVNSGPATSKVAIQAVQAKTKGNSAFKESKWLLYSPGCVELFSVCPQHLSLQGEKLDPVNPIYPSNLSAALFEMGSYNECISAILRSFAHLDSALEENSSLASRLSTRLAKSLSYSFAAGTYVSPDTDIADELARIEEAHSAHEPESGAWRVWRTLTDSGDYASEALNLARERLIDLPISKKSFFEVLMIGVDSAAAREYYTISHDDISSIVQKSSEFEDSSLTGEEDSIDLKALSKAKLSNLAFLFAGVGDARHVFGTVITLYEMYPRLSANQRKALKVHITLLDIKEHALARDLVVMFLLSKIMSCTDAIEKVELQATLFYLYTALVIPRYCYDRFSNVVKEMQVRISQDPDNFLPWIHLDNLSVSAIESALALWATRPATSPAAYVSQTRYLPSDEENSEFGLSTESDWYEHTKAFLIPFALAAGIQNSRSAAKHVRTTWVINPSLFDKAGDEIMSWTPSPGCIRCHSTDRHISTTSPVSNSVFNEDAPAFGYVTAFFDSAIIALKIHSRRRPIPTPPNAGIPESRIAQNLPVRFAKMWLSNVPKSGIPAMAGRFRCDAVTNTLVTDILPFTDTIPSPPGTTGPKAGQLRSCIWSPGSRIWNPSSRASTCSPFVIFFPSNSPPQTTLGCIARVFCFSTLRREAFWDPMGEVRWRMSRARVARMKADGWAVAVYGTHNDTMISDMESASIWKEVAE
ncbi:hypothetical protein B0H12DRAFT_1072962 [Mycena haematopus]|nr:hypothetical protein B0H12DRAFT_1072962 [Mycena haematopus]